MYGNYLIMSGSHERRQRKGRKDFREKFLDSQQEIDRFGRKTDIFIWYITMPKDLRRGNLRRRPWDMCHLCWCLVHVLHACLWYVIMICTNC